MAEPYVILAGTSKNFTSVWADPTASINSGNLYVATNGAGASFSVVDLSRTVLTDSYLIDKKGGFDEVLERTDIIDINIGV